MKKFVILCVLLTGCVKGNIIVDGWYESIEAPEPPIASPASGEYKTSQTVSLTSLTKEAQIYYSLNGGEWILYAEPFSVSVAPETTLKAYATKGKDFDSETISETYKKPDIEKPEPPLISPFGAIYSEDQTVTLYTVSKDAETYYRLNGGEWVLYAEPFKASVEPPTMVEAYSTRGEGADSDITAAIYSKVEIFIITWKDGNDAILKNEGVVKNDTPVYTGVTPTKTPTDTKSYVFNGKWSPDIVPAAANQTYTAQFEIDFTPYKVRFYNYSPDASTKVLINTVETERNETTPITIPSKPAAPTNPPGAEFAGWRLGSLSGTQYAPGASYNVSADAEFHARWDYTIQFDATLGSGNPANLKGYYNNNISLSTATAAVIPPTKYRLQYWNTQTDGKGTNYSSSYTVRGNATLYAKYQPLCDVEFEMDGGTPSREPIKNLYYGNTVSLSSKPTKDYYNFSHWSFKYNDGSDHTGTVTTTSYSIPDIASPTTITLTAHWTPIVYTLQYQDAYVVGSDTPWSSSQTFTMSTAVPPLRISLPQPPTLARDGYTFTGWTVTGTSVTSVDGGKCEKIGDQWYYTGVEGYPPDSTSNITIMIQVQWTKNN